MKPNKDGMVSALDFTKYLLAISGAVMAFLLSSETSKTIGSEALKTASSDLVKGVLSVALVFFSLSTLGGLLVLARGAQMLSDGDYSLEDRYLKIPGLINVFGFAIAFLCVAVVIAARVWYGATPPLPHSG